MGIAYSYVRFSSAKQSRGDSYRRQIEAAKRWCEQNGYTLSDQTFADLGVSAYSGKHRTLGDLAKILDLVDRKIISPGSALIIESLDRLTREDIITAQTTLLRLIDAGIVVVTLSDNQIYDKSQDNQDIGMRLMISIGVMVRAHEESKIKSERVKEAYKRRVQDTKTGQRQKITTKTPWWIEWTGDQFVISPQYQQAIKDIIDMRTKGIGSLSIARHLTDHYPPPGKSKRWHESHVIRTYKSRALVGELVTNQGVIKDYYPTVCDESTYRIINQPHNSFSGRRNPDAINNIFAGVSKCLYCHANLSYQYHRKPSGIEYHYLRCKICRKMCRYNETKLLGQLMMIDWHNVGQDSDIEDEIRLLDEEIKKQKQKIENANQQLETLIESGLDVSPLLSLINKTQSKINELQSKKQELDSKLQITYDDQPPEITDRKAYNRFLRSRIKRLYIDIKTGDVYRIEYQIGGSVTFGDWPIDVKNTDA